MINPSPPLPSGNASTKSRPAPYGITSWAIWSYILIAVGRIGELIPGLGNVPLAKIAIGIALIALLGERKVNESTKGAKSKLLSTAWILFFLSALIIPFSIQSASATRFLISGAIPIAVSFFIIKRVCSSWRHIEATLRVLVLGAGILAVIALTGGKDRIQASSSYDTNDLAYVLVTCLPICLGLAYSNKGINRLFLYGLSGLFLIAALLTQSRGGLLGLAAAVVFLMVRPFSGSRRSIAKTLAVGAIVGVMAYGVFLSLPQEARSRFQTMGNLQSDYNMEADNLTGRMSIWRRGTEAVLKRPIGYGGLTFPQVDLMMGGKFMAPHNSLIQISVEFGVLGLFLFLRLYYLSWRTLGSLTGLTRSGGHPTLEENEKSIRGISTGLIAALIANIIAGFFLSQAYSNLIWAIFAIVAAISTNIAVAPEKNKNH